MLNIEEIKESVRTINEVCNSNKECTSCPLLNGGTVTCMLLETEPYAWDADIIEDEGDVEGDNL